MHKFGIRKTIFHMLIFCSKLLSPLFFKRKYLRGYWFEEEREGWLWALKGIWFQKILGFNRSIPWPVNHTIKIGNYNNIFFNVDDIDNFQSPGNYYQNFRGKIHIGHNSYIAPNVGFITSNHDIYDLDKSLPGKDIVIGKRCWIGMNVVLLPGTILGDHTVVGAGAIVTKSFPDGGAVIAGNPAKVIKKLDLNKLKRDGN